MKESVEWEEKKPKLDNQYGKQGAPRYSYQLQMISCSKRTYKALGEMTCQANLQKVKGLLLSKENVMLCFSSHKWSFISYKNIIEIRDEEKWI